MRVVEHDDCYELCGMDDIYEAFAVVGSLKDKPVRFTLDPENADASKFYRGLIKLGRIKLHRIVFEVT